MPKTLAPITFHFAVLLATASATAQRVDDVQPIDPAADRPAAEEESKSASDSWMLSIEGVTHLPVDVGFMAGFETPFRFHAFAGYGFVPSTYLGWIARGATSGVEQQAASAIIDRGLQSGRAFRVQGGFRPFANAGLYVDAGYSRVTLKGALDDSDLPDPSVLGLPSIDFASLGVDGGYAVSSELDLWLVEIGYHAHVGRHFVLGIGAGVMGVFNSTTRVTADGANLPEADPEIVRTVDQRIERYGYVPTLTLRLGFDLI